MGYPSLQHLSLTGDPTFTLSTIHYGGDDLSKSIRRDRAGITQSRYGVPVSSRTWKNVKVWTLNINSGSQTYMESLRGYFEVGSFYLYPDIDDTDIKYTVFWMETSFNPVQIAPDQFKLKATFKETV